MTKQKTHSGTKDRIKVTRRGKTLVRKSHRNHNLSKKSPSRKRTFSKLNKIVGKSSVSIKRNLGK